MPDEFVVWRGCHDFNVDGLSWTTSRDTAAKFPFLNRYRQSEKHALLIEAMCKRSGAVLKLDRGEDEVITYEVEVLSTVAIHEDLRA